MSTITGNNFKLTEDLMEIAHRQPILNLGTIGHVAHGKSTLVKALSGKVTQQYKAELERNITIKLGYSNAKIFRCQSCPSPQCYQSLYSNAIRNPPCRLCDCPMELVNHVSFLDSPGHQQFITTMLSGTKCMDGAVLLVAANEPCPQPQTKEHIAAIEIMRVPHSIIVQNKIDLVTPAEAENNYKEIKSFISGTLANGAPIIPISAQMSFNTDVVSQYICKKIPIPNRDLESPAIMNIVRSFDINKPGCPVDYLRGGVIGGTISRGVLKVGDMIEIRPGLVSYSESEKQFKCRPIKSRITSLQSEQNALEKAYPGGLIGVGLNVDPCLSRADRLVGQVLGIPGYLQDIAYQLEIEYFLMRRVIGVEVEADEKSKMKIEPLEEGELLQLSIETCSVPAKIKRCGNGNTMIVRLKIPICASIGSQLCISRRIDKNFRIIGTGKVTNYKKVETIA